MLKILQARLQQYVNCELPDVQAGFRKGIENLATIITTYQILKIPLSFRPEASTKEV